MLGGDSKMDKKQEEKKAPVMKFKYFCPACAGYALMSEEVVKFSTKTCKNCGKTVKYDKNNWIRI